MRTKTLSQLVAVMLVFAAAQTLAVGALSLEVGGQPYTGRINIQFTFVATSAVDPATNQAVNMALFKIDTIYAAGNTTVLWKDNDSSTDPELAGIIYGLRDQAIAAGPNIYGNGLEVALYELVDGTFNSLIVTPNVTSTNWSVSTPDQFVGLTDQVGSPIALHGTGAKAIAPENPVTPYNNGTLPTDGLYEQKTAVNYYNGVLTDGTSAAFLNWDDGYLLGTVIGTGASGWSAKYPTYTQEVSPRQAMAVATQSFETTHAVPGLSPDSSAVYEAAGWDFRAKTVLGSLEATAVPEPTTMAVVAMGLFGLVARRRRRR